MPTSSSSRGAPGVNEAPGTWTRTTLGQLACYLRNGVFASRPSDDDTGTPILRISAVRDLAVDLRDIKFVQGVPRDVQAKYFVEEGDLLFTRYNGSRRLVGICARVPVHTRRIMHPDKLIRVVVDPDTVDSRFIAYQMASPAVRTFLEPRIRTTAGQSGVSGGDIKAIPVVVPSLSQQRRIVEILEDHLSRLDAAAAQVATVQQRLETWRRLTLDRLVRELASGTTKLSSLIERVEAGRSFGGSAAPAGLDEWGIIKVSAMTWGAFDAHENKAVPADRVDPRFEIRPGDVLVSRANTTEYVGAPVLVVATRPRLLLSDKSLRLVPRPGIDRSWLATVLGVRSTRRQVSRLATGTKDSMRNISQSSLLSVEVPLASEQQQREVVDRAAAIQDRAKQLNAELSSTLVRGQTLRRALLAAAFSGRLT